ncbi:putative hydrolase YdeN [Diplonema papillatum]|nr:putative hydrolase YdeN [Diplonema papillatum]
MGTATCRSATGTRGWRRGCGSGSGSVHVVLRNMPDPEVARRGVWLPFIKDRLGANERTLVIGHSSGAVAAVRRGYATYTRTLRSNRGPTPTGKPSS